jgi:DNA excision repair protein ERCC-2
MERYFEVSGFLRVWDRFDDSYVTCRQVTGKDLQLKLFCLDPSSQLKHALKRSRATIFFSATLTPADYFQDLFGCDPTAAKLAIPSPFPQKHLEVIIAQGCIDLLRPARTKRCSDQGVDPDFHSFQKGQLLCFFPSYEYMAMVVDQFEGMDEDVRFMVQAREMDDAGARRVSRSIF